MANAGQANATFETGLREFDLVLRGESWRAVTRWRDVKALVSVVAVIEPRPM